MVISVRRRHFLKAHPWRFVTVEGRVMLFSEEQPENKESGMDVMPSGRLTLVRRKQPSNRARLRVWTVEGSSTETKRLQRLKAESPITVMPSGITTCVRVSSPVNVPMATPMTVFPSWVVGS
jgi:hypothetical protein